MASRGPDEMTRARFDQIYETWHRPILGYLMRRTRPPSDAADVLAEVMLVAWRRLEEIPQGDGAGRWLFRVAQLALANHDRSGFRRARLGDRLAAEIARTTSEPRAGGIDEELAAALQRLSSDDRELLMWIAWDELDPAEISEILQLAPGTVRVRLHRARQRLRRELRRQDMSEGRMTFLNSVIKEAR